jgi:hypothetical protein
VTFCTTTGIATVVAELTVTYPEMALPTPADSVKCNLSTETALRTGVPIQQLPELARLEKTSQADLYKGLPIPNFSFLSDRDGAVIDAARAASRHTAEFIW